ncbi:MAG: hypothetical protein J7497_11430, partial [Chitinophagaceae bacterium]|nr:hypothetical protein [Chitinophagaceae bacterium]
IDKVLTASKAQLPASLATHIEQLESSVATADNNVKAGVYRQIADIYRDSAHMLLPFAWYTGEAAKLESSEKNLTFAARFFLESARTQHDDGLKNWMAGESKQLFERALALNPNNDSLKVGLGSTYFYGSFASNPMQGIMMIREVAEKDPSNMYAQYMLGVGGMMSGQIDRAIERFKVVAENQPENVEVSIMLAEAYDRKGDKTNAIKWYEFVKDKISNPDIVQELDQRIQSLKK